MDLEGNSCLLSVKNETNIKTKKILLKEVIDSKLNWQKPTKKVSAIIQLKFTDNEVKMNRLGLSGKKGWHKLIIR